MSDDNRGGHVHPRSTAQIGGHPIHPMLVPFPIACFVGVFLADVVYINSGDAGWATASIWLLGIGIATALLAAVAGLAEYFGSHEIRAIRDATKHMLANVVAVVLEIVNLLMRLGDRAAIEATGIYISGIVVLILLYSGWKGGELVFRHGVGVRDR